MNKIKILPEELSKKIAAGEVIERPFSVVKELVENSIDANSTNIKIELLSGGKKLIRVTDNGEGMSREDAKLAFKRHSTSKIANELDLKKIKTLGFRGEALPSIASVSKVVLKTRTKEELIGVKVEVSPNFEPKILDVAHPEGTVVEVMDLFYNLPVRKKFMKSERTELNLIVRYLTQLALSHTSVHVSLFNDGVNVFDYPPVNTLKERIYQIYGGKVLEKLFEVIKEQENIKIQGFFSKPPHGRPNKSWQLFFVNKRPVRDKIISSALNQAYHPFLEKGIFPIAFLFLTLPYESVDINVHPTKSEVRFLQSQKIFNFINEILREQLIEVAEIKEFSRELKKEEIYKIMEREEKYEKKEILDFQKEDSSEALILEEKKFPRVLAQYFNSYILAEDEEGLLIIDQHNAQERILYEKYKNKIEKKEWNVQEALFPILMDLIPSQQISFEKKKEALEKLGFRVEPMGGNTYALKAYPEILSPIQAEHVFSALLEEEREKNIDDLIESLIATLACKTAIKINEPLSMEKMEYIVRELFKTSNPSFCPHKRPILIRLTRKEIEKNLGRH